MSILRVVAFVSISGLALTGCLGGDDGDKGSDDTAPTAPSGLTVVPREGAAHVTWTDNSSNEDHFMVTRKAQGDAGDFAVVATVPANTAVYHDASVTKGASYSYRIVAMNAAGDASQSNEATFAAP